MRRAASGGSTPLAIAPPPEPGQESAPNAPAPPHGRGDHARHNPEPFITIAPLVLLALGALLAGYLNWPGQRLGEFLGRSPSLARGVAAARQQFAAAHQPWLEATLENWGQPAPEQSAEPHYSPLMGVSALLSIAGILLAYLAHLKERGLARRLAERYPHLTRMLEAKYWIDEVYQAAIVEPLRKLGRICYGIDRIVIDGIIWLVGFVLPESSGTALRLTTQRGYLQGYAAVMLFGVAVILLAVFW